MQDAASNEGVALHLFGSALRTVHANDLDILIVYDKRFLTVAEALSLRHDLSQSISADLGICADCILLTTQEAEQTNFGPMEGAALISPNAIDLRRSKRRAASGAPLS